MRYSLWGHVVDGNGSVIEGAKVTIYEAGTTTLATIYEEQSGGSVISGSLVIADSKGFWQVFIDDADYLSGDMFKVVTESPSGGSIYGTQTIDYVHAF
jgi:hypothetical protein